MRRSLSARLHDLKNVGTSKIRTVLHSPQHSRQASISSVEKDSPCEAPSAACATAQLVENEVEKPPTPPSTPQPASDFWDRAEESLQNSPDAATREIMASYLSLLESASESKLAARGTSVRQKQLSELTSKQIQLIEEKKWAINIGSRHIVVENAVKGIINNILKVKELVSSAASGDPHAAIACAGMSLLMSLVLKPGREYQALLEGLEYISQIICQYHIIERRYLSREHNLAVLGQRDDAFVDGLEAAFFKLYKDIIEFQARAVCHLARSSITRAFNDMFLIESWGSMVDGIRDSEAMCLKFTRVIDSEKLHTGMEETKAQLHGLRNDTKQIQSHMLDQESHKKEELDKEKWMKFLEALSTSQYEDHKNRNADRIEGTCEWSTSHTLFRGWNDSEKSSLLWVSADPGCGKSVLAKYLIDHVIPTTEGRTTCYFFFKADTTEQRSAAGALRALLHQLFTHRSSLRKMNMWVPDKFSTDGKLLTGSFSALWDVLTKVTLNEDGEVVCVLDALDECADSDRPQLTQALDRFYREAGSSKGVLKFLVTSRPYVHIQREFQLLKNTLPTIHLSGEDGIEADDIEEEINLVIKKRVQETAAKLMLEEDEQSSLQEELLKIPNRTYLWVTLIFDAIENSLKYTNKKMQETIKNLPKTVDEAYEQILSRSPDKGEARKLLHIVVSASRPFTLQEMRVALGVRLGQRQSEELDLEPEKRFATTVRSLCGLFVTIVNSRIYLLHQTAKEFLVPRSVAKDFDDATTPLSFDQSSHQGGNENHGENLWKHTLVPVESHRVVLEICVSYLLLDTFDDGLDDVDWERFEDEKPEEHALLRYSSQNWALHFRNAQQENDSYVLPFVRELCQPKSQRLETWFRISQGKTGQKAAPPTELMLAAMFGLEPIATALLEASDLDIDEEDSDYRTALSMAAESGSASICRMLLQSGARNLNLFPNQSRAPLIQAAKKGYPEIVKMLLDQAKIVVDLLDPEAEGHRTPLSYAAENGHDEIVELLLDKGACPNGLSRGSSTPLGYAAINGHVKIFKRLLNIKEVSDSLGTKTSNELLSTAAGRGHDAIVKALLDMPNVEPDHRDPFNQSPLYIAAESGHLQVVKLLTATGRVDLDAKDRFKNQTPLLRAAMYSHHDIVQHLIKVGAKMIECEERWPRRTALSYSCESGNPAVVKSLMETGLANPNSKSSYGRTPLSFACGEGNVEVVKQLLAFESIEIDPADDGYGRTPLSWAASKGYKEVIQLLLDTDDVDLFSKDKSYHRTPGMWAAVGGHSDVARLLQYEEPEEEAEEEDAEEGETEEPKKVVLVTPAGELVLI